jgi:3-hydroxymyristoyl/3-hydroxydecanoyl-(acyl carrier protein) dehydratase
VAAHSAELQVRADEPSAAGHFPGNPIVPGAVLLRELLRVLSPDGVARGCEIRSARFYQPVRPGDRLTLGWDEQQAGTIAFTCSARSTGQRVLSGTLCLRSR